MPRLASHEARGLLLSALSLASKGELERAAQKAQDAAEALRSVLSGTHDAETEVRRVMAEPMRRGAEHVSKPVARVMRGLASKVEG